MQRLSPWSWVLE